MCDAQNLRSMDNQMIHVSTIRLAEEERRITRQLLLHLREIERRRIYLDHECGSLHEYCTKILKYSEGAASRRVNASRLLEAMPEISEKLIDGRVNLSTLSLAQTFIRAEEKRTGQKISKEQRRDVVQKIEGASQKDTLRLLTEAMPEVDVRTGATRPLAAEETLFQIIADPEFVRLYERVRELNSHKPEFLQPRGLFKALLNEHLDRHAPERKTSTRGHTAAVSRNVRNLATEKALFEKSGGQCQHVDGNGRRCTRRYQLQIDHVFPRSRGGGNELSNLQHLCRAHNLKKGNLIRSPSVAYSAGQESTQSSWAKVSG